MLCTEKRFRTRVKRKACQYLRCGAKTATFLFWASLYMVVMKMTLFKDNVNTPVKDWSIEPDDNYTKWLMQGPVLGEDEPETKGVDWSEPDEKTILEHDKRAAKVRDVCRNRHLYNQSIRHEEFFIDYNHNLVWCNIFKAASSFWLYNFNILGGYDKKFLAKTRHSPLMLARKKFPRPSEEELKDAINTPGVISLLVVRDPFVRLLSAYRDKIENIYLPYYRKLARLIIAAHREHAIKVLGPIKSFGPTFFEFVAYLINNYKTRDKKYDEHWAPYHEFCSPCAVNFSVVAKVETLKRDTAYVLQQLGLGHVLDRIVGDRRTRLRTVMNKSRDGKNTTSLLRHYFSQLDENMLDDLLQIYGLDFEMFGYDSNIYKKYIKNKRVH